MGPNKERRRGRSSPARDPIGSSGFEPRASGSRSARLSPSSTSLVDTPFITEDEDANLLKNLKISPNPNFNPRIFPQSVKQQCWEKAEKIRGRDPGRWRRDALGNIVFRKLVGCPGCLCHDYDHIVPYSKVI